MRNDHFSDLGALLQQDLATEPNGAADRPLNTNRETEMTEPTQFATTPFESTPPMDSQHPSAPKTPTEPGTQVMDWATKTSSMANSPPRIAVPAAPLYRISSVQCLP